MRDLIPGHRNDSYLLEVAILRQTMTRRINTFSTTDRSRNTAVRGQQEKVSSLVVAAVFSRICSLTHSVPGIGINTKTCYHHIVI